MMFTVKFQEHKHQRFKYNKSKVVLRPQAKNRPISTVVWWRTLTRCPCSRVKSSLRRVYRFWVNAVISHIRLKKKNPLLPLQGFPRAVRWDLMGGSLHQHILVYEIDLSSNIFLGRKNDLSWKKHMYPNNAGGGWRETNKCTPSTKLLPLISPKYHCKQGKLEGLEYYLLQCLKHPLCPFLIVFLVLLF